MENNTYTVYMHINKINNKKYIGITKNKLTRRWKSNGVGYKTSTLFWNAIQKYGWDNFEHEIIETGISQDKAKLQANKDKYKV